MKIKASNCKESEFCMKDDFTCEYAEPGERKAITHEICCYVEGICNCQFYFENNRSGGEYSGSTYKNAIDFYKHLGFKKEGKTDVVNLGDGLEKIRMIEAV